MNWNRWLSEITDGESPAHRQERLRGLHSLRLIHALPQRMELIREAIAKGQPRVQHLALILPIVRKLLDARVAVLRIDRPPEIASYVSTGDTLLDGLLSSNEALARLCLHLFAAPQPFLVGNALEGDEFADPLLRSMFPRLSFLSTAWHLPDGDISFALFSDLPGHFHLDQIDFLHYFNPWRHTSSCFDGDHWIPSVDERGWIPCAPGLS